MTDIKLKRSAVTSNVPTTVQLALGEMAINTFDGKLFIKRDNGAETIVELLTTLNGLQLSGGTLTGALTLSGAPTVDLHAATKKYVDDQKDIATEYTKTQNFNATTLTDAASISWDLQSNQVTSVTLGGNRALANPTNMVDGATYILTVKQDATGSRTLSYGSAYKFPGGTAPTLTTTANAVDIITFVSDGTNMYGVISKDFK